jgi:hypothetical protein
VSFAALLFAGCVHNKHGAAAVQYIESGRRSLGRDGLGLAFYGLPSGDEEIGWFVDAHATRSGGVDGPRVDDVPEANRFDPVVDRSTDAVVVHLGPTARITDWLFVHAGVGLGNRREQKQRFDSSFSLADDGFYRTSSDHWRASGSFGVLVQPYDGALLGVGYDLFFEGVVFSLGFAW